MKVVEKFVKGKFNKEELCEDGICVTENFIALIDGVTSNNDFRYNGKKSGRLIRDLLIEAIPKLSSKLDCYQAVDFLNEYILNFYKENNLFENLLNNPANQPAASIIIYSQNANQIWLIGDSMALYGNTILENPLEFDEIYTKMRVIIIDFLLNTGYTEEQLLENDISKEFIKELQKQQPYIKNKVNNSKFDYVVIDGFNRPNKNLIKCIDVPKDIKEIVFTSDGYRKPFNTLKETEEYLWYIKEVDPLCYKEFAYAKGFYKNQESYDDRSYIRFEI